MTHNIVFVAKLCATATTRYRSIQCGIVHNELQPIHSGRGLGSGIAGLYGRGDGYGRAEGDWLAIGIGAGG